MLRNAIIITTASSGFENIEAVKKLWCGFLKSNIGGGWYENEIICPPPTLMDVSKAIESAKHADYSLVVFIGRGAMKKAELPWMETRIELNEKEALWAERQLNTGALRLSLILDCCCNLSQPTPSVHLSENNPYKITKTDLAFYRETFEEKLYQAEQGMVKIISAAVNHGNCQNVSFSHFLLDSIREWSEHHDRKTTLSWRDAVTQSCLPSDGQSQIDYQGGRRLHHFPVAIGLSFC